MIESIILCTVFGVFILISFTIGLYYGSKVKRDENITLPNPVKKVKQIKKTKELEAKVERQKLIDEINLANIENSDGTGFGQQDFPEE